MPATSIETTRRALADHCGCAAVTTALGATCWPIGPAGPIVTVDPAQATITVTTTRQRTTIPYQHPAQAGQLAAHAWACDAALSIADAAHRAGGTIETYGPDADSPAAARIYGRSVYCRIYQHYDGHHALTIEARRPDGSAAIIWDSTSQRPMPSGPALARALTETIETDHA